MFINNANWHTFVSNGKFRVTKIDTVINCNSSRRVSGRARVKEANVGM